jgi:Uma2 family endonuclease
MSALPEIVLSETKPETEWVRGRPLQKVSPTYRHGRLQSLLSRMLTAWAEGRGRVATEWRFRVNPPGEAIRPLVPDVAYLSYRRLPAAEDGAAQTPLGAPDVAVEILSPDDRTADVEDKIAAYLRAKCSLIVVVDSEAETMLAIDARRRTTFARGAVFRHGTVEGLEIAVSTLFDDARR